MLRFIYHLFYYRKPYEKIRKDDKMSKKIDLYNIFNVKDGQIFRIKDKMYIIKRGVLYETSSFSEKYKKSSLSVNDLNTMDYLSVVKYPVLNIKEIWLLKITTVEINWIARDFDGELCGFEREPYKNEGLCRWANTEVNKDCKIYSLDAFNDLFKFVSYEDKEPFCVARYKVWLSDNLYTIPQSDEFLPKGELEVISNHFERNLEYK